MSTYKNLISLGAAAVFALGLAACSSSGDGTPPANGGDGGDTKPPKTALSYATDLDTSVMALDKLAGAATAEGSALKMAADAAGKLGVIDSGGDSSMETMNAQAILNAKKALTDAVTDAKAKKTAAETARSGTSDADVTAALDNAIEDAKTAIEDAEEVLDATGIDTLADYVDDVTGGKNADPQGTPASKGKAVADAINAALTTGGDRVPAPADIPSDHTPSATIGKLVMGPSDAQGMTWAEIGGSALMNFRIVAGSGSAPTRAVKAKSVADMTAGKLGLTSAPATADGTEINDDVQYKGIDGVLFCAGTDCKVKNVVADTFAAATSKLTGSWYFAPDRPSTATYTEGTGTNAGTYSYEDPSTSYVRYGYWLSQGGTPAVTTINRYHSGPTAQGGAVYGISSTVDAFKEPTASYKGSALGMSVVQTFDSKGKELSRASGGFTADVSLTMNFGNNPWLQGTISNFEGSAVDSSWSVTLGNASLSGGNATGTTGKDPNSGTWSARAWGGSAADGSQARPTGVYGAFTADFTNGAAAGVYATRKTK